MLSISKPIRGADHGEYYLSLASMDDYYLDGKEPPGFWLGEGARALGLSGLLSKDQFRNLFRGLSPDGEQALVHNAKSLHRRAGWDVTWSVPKSVSTVWSQADLQVRLTIERCVNAAVGEGVRYLETIGLVSRRGEDGVIREQAMLVFAAFPHSTSRALDPQLHVHTLLINVAVRPDGSTGSLLTLHESHFALRDLIRALADEAQGRGLGARDVYGLRDSILRTRQAIPVGERARETRFTTPEMLEVERQFLVAARQLHAEARPFTPTQAQLFRDDAMSRFPTLSAEQRSAILAVTELQGGIQLVAGMAGTGKSFAFGVAKGIWEGQGMEVHGACLSGKAAAGLQEGSNVESRTLHRLLWGIHHGAINLASRSVVLVDEAAMVGTRQLLDLTSKCLAAGAKLVLAGDVGQLQSVEAGGGFGALIREFGAATLTEIQRQRDEWARQAVKDFAAGRSDQALAAYDGRGLLHLETQPEFAERALVAHWQKSESQDPASQVILAGTNAEVTRLNELAQKTRLASGLVTGDPISLGEERLHVSDRVLFTRNSLALSVFNGELGTVTARAGTQLTVAMDQGRTVTVDTLAYSHLRLGYALTTHKAQGMTTEQSYILAGPMQNRELTYVQASRARGDTRFFVGSEDLQRTADRMARSQPKELATDLAAEGPVLELVPNR